MTNQTGSSRRPPKPFSAEVRDRAVRFVAEPRPAHETHRAAIRSIAEKIGRSLETTRLSIRRVEHDAGQRPAVTTVELEKLIALECENQADARERHPPQGQCVFRGSGARPLHEVTPATRYAFIHAHRTDCGDEPICRVLNITHSDYRVSRQRQRETKRRSARAQRDAFLEAGIARVDCANHAVYGVRKVWRPLQRYGTIVARGIQVRATRPALATEASVNFVQRQSDAERPNQLWVAHLLYLRRDKAWFRSRRLRDRCLLAPHRRFASAYDHAQRAGARYPGSCRMDHYAARRT